MKNELRNILAALWLIYSALATILTCHALSTALLIIGQPHMGQLKPTEPQLP
jgi:hypothetical protein